MLMAKEILHIVLFVDTSETPGVVLHVIAVEPPSVSEPWGFARLNIGGTLSVIDSLAR